MEASPRRERNICRGAGGTKPARLSRKPEAVAQIRGLRATSRRAPASPWRASIHTADRLARGTAAPTMRPMVAMPGVPKSSPAAARAM